MFILPHLKGLTAGSVASNTFKSAALDLNFASTKSLVDSVSKNNLITFTRAGSAANAATYVGSDGLIKTAVTNLVLNSEDFSAATWATTNSAVTVNAAVAPNGATTADALLETFVNSDHNIYTGTQTFTTATQSIYVKPNGRTNIALRFFYTVSDWVTVVFNLTGNGSVTQSSAGPSSAFSAVSSSIVNVGNDWYRISMTATQSSRSAYTLALDLCTTSTPTLGAVSGTESYVGDTSKGVYLWGAQFQTASTVGEYVPTGATINSAPRFDHNPTTGESLGLLVEEARTNSVTNNTMVGAVAGTPGTLPTGWGIFVSPTGLTRTIVGSGTVNGINYIDVRFNGTPSSTGEITLYLSSTATAATSGQAWTASAWLSLAGGSTSNIAGINFRNFELNSGVYVRETSTNFVSSISSVFIRQQNITTSFGASANQIQSVLSVTATAGGTPIDITLRIGLPQLEQGAFATSPILTSTATATRAADVASITGSNFSSWYNQTEGTMFAAFRDPGVGANRSPYFISDGSVNNRIGLFNNITTTVNHRIVNGGASTNPGNLSLASSALNKHAITVKAETNGAIAACNGALSTAASPASAPAVTQLAIGSFAGTQDYNNAPINRLTYFPTRLSNEVLQRITQP